MHAVLVAHTQRAYPRMMISLALGERSMRRLFCFWLGAHTLPVELGRRLHIASGAHVCPLCAPYAPVPCGIPVRRVLHPVCGNLLQLNNFWHEQLFASYQPCWLQGQSPTPIPLQMSAVEADPTPAASGACHAVVRS